MHAASGHQVSEPPVPLAPLWHPATPSYPAVFHSSWVAGLSGAGQDQGMSDYAVVSEPTRRPEQQRFSATSVVAEKGMAWL